jgi:predicted deacetylase
MRCAERHSVCFSVHDVAPATWPRCARLLAMLDECGAGPVTLLVVPDYHHGGRIDAYPAFVRAIERRLARGDEVALHGYYHEDDAAPPRGPLGWIERRVLTQGEGEFAALGAGEALARLERGAAVMAALKWPARAPRCRTGQAAPASRTRRRAAASTGCPTGRTHCRRAWCAPCAAPGGARCRRR